MKEMFKRLLEISKEYKKLSNEIGYKWYIVNNDLNDNVFCTLYKDNVLQIYCFKNDDKYSYNIQYKGEYNRFLNDYSTFDSMMTEIHNYYGNSTSHLNIRFVSQNTKEKALKEDWAII